MEQSPGVTPFPGARNWTTQETLVAGPPQVDTPQITTPNLVQPGSPLYESWSAGQEDEDSVLTSDQVFQFITGQLPDISKPWETSEFLLDLWMDARFFAKGAAAGALIPDGPLMIAGELVGGLMAVAARRGMTTGAKRLWRHAMARLDGIIDLGSGGMLNTGTGVNYSQGSLFDVTEYLGPLKPDSKVAARLFNELIATKSGYTSMAEYKRTVLNRWPRKYQEQLFRELWQNRNYEGYVEHLIQKAPHMDWYWNLKGKDSHAVDNVRILFNDSMKGFKDSVERIVHGFRRKDGTFVPGKGWQSPNLEDRLIVSFEDPMKKTRTFLRQNPGDIVIMRAGSNKIIGNLGQYFDILYPQDALGKRLLREGIRKAGFKDLAQFRRTILEQRIDIIIANSSTIPANRTAAKRWIKANIDEDMVNLIQKYPFLQPPPAIKKQMIKDGLLPGPYISPID